MPAKAESPIYQLKITLRDIRPPIWRRVQVPGDIGLVQLHDVIQAVMGWASYHLYAFTVGGESYYQDEEMIDATLRYATQEGIRPDAFEFQMLFGVRRDLQRRLVADGWRVRVYIPFGEQWYPYLMRRLAERPANMLFLAGSVVRESPLGFLWPNGRRRRHPR